MGHYDNGEHGSNAPGDVEMARALPAGSLADESSVVTRKIRSAWRQRKQKTGRLRAGYAMQTRSTKRHLDCGRRMSGANTWDGPDFEFRNGEMKMVNYQLIPVNLKKKVTWEDGKSARRVLYTPEIDC